MPKGKYKRSTSNRKILRNNKLGKSKKYNKLDIFKRDNYTCQMCKGIFSEEFLSTYRLPNFKKSKLNPNIIITLCKDCYRICVNNNLNVDDIKNYLFCRRKTKIIYPIGKSPDKSWYTKIYGGKKINKTTPKTEGVSLEKIVNFTKKALKERMIQILKDRNQNPDDWHFNKWFKTLVI